MSQSTEIWQLIGTAITSRRWDRQSEAHITVKLPLVSSSQQTIINDIRRISRTDGKISSSTNKIYYLCQEELYKLLPAKFLLKVNDKKMAPRHIEILDAIDRPASISQLLTTLKREVNVYNDDHLTDQIIQIFVNMINCQHTVLDTEEANKSIDGIKQSLLSMNDKIYLLNDMVISFSWNNKFMVNVHFSTNIVNLESGLLSGTKSVLDSKLHLDDEQKISLLSKHFLFDPEYEKVMENECKKMKDMNERWNKLMIKRLQQLQIVLTNDYNLLDDEYDEELPIYFYTMVDEARAKNERLNHIGIYCIKCGTKNRDSLWLYCKKHGFIHYDCTQYASFCCPYC